MESSLAADLLGFGREAAWRAGLRADDREDCAATFAVHICDLKRAGRLESIEITAAWLHSCARHFAWNYVRTERRRLAHEAIPCPRGKEATDVFWDVAGDEPGPEAVALGREFGERVSRALSHLSTEDQVLFHQQLAGSTSAEIARAQGIPPAAVRKQLERCRKQLRAVLLWHGMDEAEAWDYVRLSASASRPAVTRRGTEDDDADHAA